MLQEIIYRISLVTSRGVLDRLYNTRAGTIRAGSINFGQVRRALQSRVCGIEMHKTDVFVRHKY